VLGAEAVRPADHDDLARRVAEHVAAVRRIDVRLRSVPALIAMENDHADTAVAQTLKSLKAQPAELLGVWEAVHTERGIEACRKRGRNGKSISRPQLGLNQAFLASRPADSEGRTRPGSYTGANKPTMCELLGRVLEQRRLYFHKHMVAAAGPDEEQYEAFQQHLMDEGELELQAMLRVTPAGRQERTPVFATRFIEQERAAIRTQFFHEFREFRYIETVKQGRDSGTLLRWARYTGKEQDGPHNKRDDLVMAAAQAVFTVACVANLESFAHVCATYF